MKTNLKKRIIPVLLLADGKLVKTVRFSTPKYIGDPINAVKIFNEKEVDELIILDISAKAANIGPNIKLISEIASECFMPLCYGGGIRNLDQVKSIFDSGIEKVALNTIFYDNPKIAEASAKIFGSQAIVAGIDVKSTWFSKNKLYSNCGSKAQKIDLIKHAHNCVNAGAGEILLNSVDRDGTYKGYDIELIKKLTGVVNVPVIALGGASSSANLDDVIELGGAAAAAAGSIFVFHGRHRAVLINVPRSA